MNCLSEVIGCFYFIMFWFDSAIPIFNHILVWILVSATRNSSCFDELDVMRTATLVCNNLIYAGWLYLILSYTFWLPLTLLGWCAHIDSFLMVLSHYQLHGHFSIRRSWLCQINGILKPCGMLFWNRKAWPGWAICPFYFTYLISSVSCSFSHIVY